MVNLAGLKHIDMVDVRMRNINNPRVVLVVAGRWATSAQEISHTFGP